MLKTLENDILRLTVDTHGAEIHSLVAKDTGIEYIWQADPNYWQRHAPILFPIVGKLKNGQYEYDGTVYRMPGHGFARDKARFHCSKKSRIERPEDPRLPENDP